MSTMKQDDNKKKLDTFFSTTLRGIKDAVNANDIHKEDIVQIIPNSEGFVLLYYK